LAPPNAAATDLIFFLFRFFGRDELVGWRRC
jgi:hypothetical protein